MSEIEAATDEERLAERGITDPRLMEMARVRVPCAITSATEALDDRTKVAINAPRAMMVLEWKGVVRGLALASEIVEADAKALAAEQEARERAEGLLREALLWVQEGRDSLVHVVNLIDRPHRAQSAQDGRAKRELAEARDLIARIESHLNPEAS